MALGLFSIVAKWRGVFYSKENENDINDPGLVPQTPNFREVFNWFYNVF